MKPRQEFRQHSKSTLLRASAKLFAEREAIVAVEARMWMRRLVRAAIAAFVAGAGLGVTVARWAS